MYVSLEGLPSSSSLRITGYWPAFVGSKTPGAAIARTDPADAGKEFLDGCGLWKRLVLEGQGNVWAGNLEVGSSTGPANWALRKPPWFGAWAIGCLWVRRAGESREVGTRTSPDLRGLGVRKGRFQHVPTKDMSTNYCGRKLLILIQGRLRSFFVSEIF